MKKTFLFILTFLIVSSPVFADYEWGSTFDQSDLKIKKNSIDFAEQDSNPPVPAANHVKLYAKDDGSGNTIIYTIDSDSNVVKIGGPGMDAVTVNSSAVDTTANFLDNIYMDFSLADGGAGGPDDVTSKFNYNAASGNLALLTTEVAFTADGLVAEGTTADNIEIYLQFPNPVTTDKTITFFNATDTVVGKATTDTLTNKTLAAADNIVHADDSVNVVDADYGDVTVASGAWAVEDDSHAHTTTTISGIDISDDTNLAAGAGLLLTGDSLSTDSTEASFLASGALTCGAATQGKAKVHTTPLQYCDNAATPALQYAAYGSSSGVATSATSAAALAANGANCSAGYAPLGVDAAGAAESCTDYEEEVTEGSLADSTIVSADIKDGTIVSADLSGTAGVTLAQTAMTAGRSLTIATNDVAADAELYTDTKTLWFQNPTAADDFKTIWTAPVAATLTKISCESDQTVVFDLQVDDGSPAAVNGSDITCTTFATDSVLSGDATMAAGDRLDLALTSVSGTPTWVSISWEFTYDD